MCVCGGGGGGGGGVKANSQDAICSNDLYDILVSLTHLTEVGVIFVSTRCDISWMLQVVTTNRIV